jgi:hypothetical protein
MAELRHRWLIGAGIVVLAAGALAPFLSPMWGIDALSLFIALGAPAFFAALAVRHPLWSGAGLIAWRLPTAVFAFGMWASGGFASDVNPEIVSHLAPMLAALLFLLDGLLRRPRPASNVAL